MYKKIAVMALCALMAGASRAQELPSVLSEQGQALLMGPLAKVHLGEGPQKLEAVPSQGDQAKSPRRAFLYSALLPGAGELYAGARKRAAVFFGIEAITAGLYFSWKGKGDDIEKEFRQMADQSWDPLNYLAWRGSTISRNSSITHALPCSSYVRGYVETGKFQGCPESEVQQYYELIGKYNQFAAGWTDLVRAETGNAVQPTEVDSVENFLSEIRLQYEDKRDESNRFLKRASNLAGVILVNHALSAIDAARVARGRASGVSESRLERRTRFEFVLYPGSRGQVPMAVAIKPFD
jgi:hypothetical protein